MSVAIEKDMIVKLAYRLIDEGGRVLDERSPDYPYEYMQGRGQIVGPVERLVDFSYAGSTKEAGNALQDESLDRIESSQTPQSVGDRYVDPGVLLVFVELREKLDCPFRRRLAKLLDRGHALVRLEGLFALKLSEQLFERLVPVGRSGLSE